MFYGMACGCSPNESEWRQEAPLPASTVSGLWCSGAAGCVIDDRFVFICAEAGFLKLDTRTGVYESSLPAHPSVRTQAICHRGRDQSSPSMHLQIVKRTPELLEACPDGVRVTARRAAS